jgi:hypothetical protein
MEARAQRPWRRHAKKKLTLALPWCKRGRKRAHGMEEVQAELEVEAIEDGCCGGGARRRRVGRRRAVTSTPARLAATVESEHASEEGGRGQRRWRRRQCTTGWGLRRVGGATRRVRRCMDATWRARSAAVGQRARTSGRRKRGTRRGLGQGSALGRSSGARVSNCGCARELGWAGLREQARSEALAHSGEKLIFQFSIFK